MATAYHDSSYGGGSMPGDYGGYGPDPGYMAVPSDYGGYGPDAGGYGPDAGGYGMPPQHYPQDQPYDDDVQLPQEYGQRQEEGNRTYQQYTEGKVASKCIDAENGIAPRRCTDCVCMFVFLFYVLGMVVLVIVARSATVNDRPWGDIRRLTHGHDYQGRLCGVDPAVAAQPFLFWCRLDPKESVPAPTKLNLGFPSCVAACPTNTTDVVPCLFPQEVRQMSIQGGPFGTLETYHVQFQQSVADTFTYASEPFAGRFCVPDDPGARSQVLLGPMKFAMFFSLAGSLQDPWLVLFGASVLSIALGYVYLFAIKLAPRVFVMSLLYFTWILLTLCGGFMLFATVDLAATLTGSTAILKTVKFDTYMKFNPLYEELTPESATFWSIAVGALLWVFGCCVLGIISHVAGQGFHYVPDLIDAAAECWTAMSTMLIPPGIEGLVKFILLWVLSYNFMFLVAVGWYDTHRLMVNERLYKDATANFHYESSWTHILGVLYYLFGCVWIMELANACGQFLVSFAVISWYFMKKDGALKTGVPPNPAVYGALGGALHHAGSICLGAAIIPWVRLIRVFNWVEDEAVPNEEAACCAQDASGCVAASVNKLCACVGKICSGITAKRKSCCTPACCGTSPEPRTESLFSAGCAYRYSKNAYNDVIIRSQHFLQASQRAFLLINKYDSTKTYLLEGKGCQVVTCVGVVSIGCVGMVFTYLGIMMSPALTDPTSASYVAQPIAISLMGFGLCANIAYGFMMLFDHTADTLLYCYAWNKKFSKDNNGAPVDDYLPESLRDIVDADLDEDDGYCFYGQARPEMYLSTWLGRSRRGEMKEERFASKARQSQVGSSGAPSVAGSRASAGFPGAGQVAYQQVPGNPPQAMASYPPGAPGGAYYDQGYAGGYGYRP